MTEIAGIRRRSNAEEGARRFFQTSNQIATHFKRDADKKKLFELVDETNTFTNLLIASSAIHVYHYLGVHTKSESELSDSVSGAQALEQSEKKEIFTEIGSLVNHAIQFELELSNLALDYEQQILSAMIEDKTDENFQFQLKDEIELNLVEALNKYPIVQFFDHIGYLTGMDIQVKDEILAETSGLKATSIDLEKDLIANGQADNYIECSTLNLLIEKMKKSFEFSSVRDLKLETFPIRKMLNHIIKYRLNLYPVSKRGLEAYSKATKVKKQIYEAFLNANSTKVAYDDIELHITARMAAELRDMAYQGPNVLVYFLKNLLELSFEEIYDLLATYGIADVSSFCELQKFDLKQFFMDTKINQLNKITFKKLGSHNNELYQVEQELNRMKKANLVVTNHSVKEIFEFAKEHELNYLKEACSNLNISFENFRMLFQKSQIIKNKIQKKYPLQWVSAYAMLFEMPEIYQNISRYVYFSFFNRICRQIARILESYIKLKEDKSLYLLGLKRVFSCTPEEQWVAIKIEELIIQRIRHRQEELSIIFNAENDAYLVNSFILARIFDTTAQEAKKILMNEPSPVYEDIIEISLPQDMISPVSYIFAFDILNRFKLYQETLKLQKEQIQENFSEKLKIQQTQLVEKQQSNTLNWIEKKITSVLMSVKTDINPTALYWSEKDQKIATDTAKLHSDLQNRKICNLCGEDTTEEDCRIHGRENVIQATPADQFCQYYNFSMLRIKELQKMKVPTYEDLKAEVLVLLNESMEKRLHKAVSFLDSSNLIEGERFEIASKIAKEIGLNLDKAVYKKFKKMLKK